jgi:hypothetical protein
MTDHEDEDDELRPAVRRVDEDRGGNVAGTFNPAGPLEPQGIDPENAAFVLLGVVLVVGFLIAAIVGF